MAYRRLYEATGRRTRWPRTYVPRRERQFDQEQDKVDTLPSIAQAFQQQNSENMTNANSTSLKPIQSLSQRVFIPTTRRAYPHVLAPYCRLARTMGSRERCQ